jgi:hypothetical protein
LKENFDSGSEIALLNHRCLYPRITFYGGIILGGISMKGEGWATRHFLQNYQKLNEKTNEMKQLMKSFLTESNEQH